MSKLSLYKSFDGMHLIHPTLFQNISRELDSLKKEVYRIRNADKLISFYFKLLKKSIVKKFTN